MTRRLIVMRHAKSDWSRGLSDHARPLNERGRRSADALGTWMRETAHAPDQVLCSSAVRTRETLDRLALPDAAVRFEEALYLAEADGVLRVLRHAKGQCVMVLGHNPGLQEFAARIVAAPIAHPRAGDYPTGATLVADLDIEDWTDLDWGAARTVSFVVPRELPGV
ncbi:SixA phosphatase family protein [Roseivivax marinus]|uniref:SixA phosphatase family protein n=1 Tax=Roseivivax marinus TaxID=1379903 RepID=UPI003511A6F3